MQIHNHLAEKATHIFVRPTRHWMQGKEFNNCHVKYFFFDAIRDESLCNYNIIEDIAAPQEAAQIRKQYKHKVTWLKLAIIKHEHSNS
jgi:hypothetical protein